MPCTGCTNTLHLPADAAALQVPDGVGSYRPLDYRSLQATINHFVAMAGLDAQSFSCHSLHRGGCTFLALQGAPIDEIKTRGDWSSDAVYKYMIRPLAERIVSDIHVASSLGEVV